MKRYGSVIQVRPEKLERYKELHAATWEGVLKRNHECNIRNYTIYYRDGLLFSHFEYIGDDYEGDMQKMAADPVVQEWWKECIPCQEKVATAAEEDWWAPMEEVFHQD
ncbi:MAG: L-rhamnose mutarotase [Rikenellaceae bacterium]